MLLDGEGAKVETSTEYLDIRENLRSTAAEGNGVELGYEVA